MKTLLTTLLIATTFFATTAFGQTNNSTNFHGAAATLKSYKALYYINQSDEKKIKGTLRNINNALNDPRLKGKLTVELVAFGDGVEMFKKENHYDTLLTALQKAVYCWYNAKTPYGNAKSVKMNCGLLSPIHPVVMAKSSFASNRAGQLYIHNNQSYSI